MPITELKSTRRQFIKASVTATGGLSLAVNLPGCATFNSQGLSQNQSWVANAWLEISKDSDVIFTLDRIEMGQGTTTGLTTLLAEELEVEPSEIVIKYAPVDSVYRNPDYGLQMTGGSNSISSSWRQIRESGAAAREMLIEAAAEVYGVPIAQCVAESGKVVLQGSGKALSYGELAKLAASKSVPSKPKLKKASEFRYIVKQNARLDIA
jgi:isoquinoline 1-oxidoreductase/isoquinoline 1-oxidoreductase beta subunit